MSNVTSLKNVRLGDVIDIRDGTHDTPRYVTQGVPLLTGKNLSDSGLCFDDINFISQSDHDEISKRSAVSEGDILYGMIGTIGKPTIVETQREFSIKNIALFKQSNPQIHNRFLLWLLDSADIRRQIGYASKGGTQKFVSLGSLRGITTTFPVISEQRRIAAILDQADALRAKRREALAQLASLTQSIFIDMFGDPIDNTMDWPTKQLMEIVRVRRGGSPRPIEQFLGGTVNWIKIGDATRGDDIYLSHCREKITTDGLKKTVFLKKGSLIFANCGVSLGFARILEIDGCIHDGWLSFDEFDEGVLNKLFFLKALNSVTERFRAMAPAGTQPNLNTAIMKNFSMILPPIAIQRKFAEKLEEIRALKATYETSLAGLDTLFSSLQHRAFQGEL